MGQEPSEDNSGSKNPVLNFAMVTLQVGCLTFIIAGLFTFVGFWLDTRFETRPWLTLGMLILSVPLTLSLVYMTVKARLNKKSLEENGITALKEELAGDEK
ncbi:MAG: AtpZ/AtpI family protein, partial [Chloroflexota bacterium]